jgi:hypothetical protein
VTYQEYKSLFTSGGGLHGVVSETHADEDDGEDGESHELGISASHKDNNDTHLNWLSPPAIDERKSEVVTR